MELFGKKINNWWIVGGAAGVVGIVYFFNRANSGSSTAATSGSSATDPVTGLPYSQDSQVDPLTGMTYLQEAQEYGSVQAAEAAVSNGSAYGLPGSDSAYSGDAGYAYYPTSTASATGTVTSYSTNAQWAQAVTAGLSALGYSSEDISAALGLYFQGLPLGTAPDGVSYQTLVQAAVAEFGPPPVGSYSIIGAATSSTGVGGTGGTGGTGGSGSGSGSGTGTTTTAPAKVRVPGIVGDDVVNASSACQSAGLLMRPEPAAVKGKTHIVTSQKPAEGTMVAKGSTVTITYKTS